MKIRVLSDLHMEGYKFYYEYFGEDVVILAGDIHTQLRHSFIIEQIPMNVKIIMVAGNHEYYGADFDETNLKLKELEDFYFNFKFLNNEAYEYNGVSFFGGTMFTDFELYGKHTKEESMQIAFRGIADFWHIKYKDDYWEPKDHLNQHNEFKAKLKAWLDEKHEKRIVISHFVPHPQGGDMKFAGSPLNPYFISNMEEYMGWTGFWVCGHTHSSINTKIGNTRLICNPRGYGQENRGEFNNGLVLEI